MVYYIDAEKVKTLHGGAIFFDNLTHAQVKISDILSPVPVKIPIFTK